MCGSSQPNVFGGYDTKLSNGSENSSQKNIFGGQDIRTRHGTIQSQPNIFGGYDYRLPDGRTIQSQRNVFGGQTYRYPDGRVVECAPNISSAPALGRRSMPVRNRSTVVVPITTTTVRSVPSDSRGSTKTPVLAYELAGAAWLTDGTPYPVADAARSRIHELRLVIARLRAGGAAADGSRPPLRFR